MGSAASRQDSRASALREGRRQAAFAFVDIVGYSTLMSEDEERTHARWMEVLNEVIRPLTREHGGTLVKSTGDGVLADFATARHAMEWSRRLQHAAAPAARPQDEREQPLTLRIAVHQGDIFFTKEDIYGDSVNVAARLQEFAAPGGIIFTETVYRQVQDLLDEPVRDLGFVELRNLLKPVRAYALEPAPSSVKLPVRPRAGALPSIAVLPLQNMGGDPADDYFAEGVVEDIIVSLSGLHELMVIARSSTLMYRGRQPDPRAVGRNLGVRYILTGSMRRSQKLVRVTTQLSDTYTGATLWGDRTEVPPGELFDVQDRIVARVVSGIAPHVRAIELQDALRKRPDSFTAYDFTLRALDIMNTLDRSTFMQARDFLAQAMAEDPNFAMPVAWSARWYSLCYGQGWSVNPAADMATAAELASRAIELDRQNALALATYGHLRSFLFHDYDSALIYFDRALSACPNSSLAWILSSATLSYVGRGEQAVRHADHGLWLSPFDQSLFQYYMFLSLAHYANGSFDEAVRWGRMSANENPHYTSNLRMLAAALVAIGRMDEARGFADQLRQLEPGFDVEHYERARQPFRDEALKQRFMGQLRQALSA